MIKGEQQFNESLCKQDKNTAALGPASSFTLSKKRISRELETDFFIERASVASANSNRRSDNRGDLSL